MTEGGNFGASENVPIFTTYFKAPSPHLSSLLNETYFRHKKIPNLSALREHKC